MTCDKCENLPESIAFAFCLECKTTHMKGVISLQEQWPKGNEDYWFITETGNIIEDQWLECLTDKQVRDFLGIYRTKTQAEEVRDKVREFIKTLNN